MKYVIPGNPRPLMRPRYVARNIYDPQTKTKHELASIIEELHGNAPLYEGPLALIIKFFMQAPKKYNGAPLYHTGRPDLSNLVKLIEDVCNKLLYADDSIIVHINASKEYSTEPRTEFELIPLKKF